MQILKNGCDVVRRRDAADEPGSNIWYTLKFCQIFVGPESMSKRQEHEPNEWQCHNQGTDEFYLSS